MRVLSILVISGFLLAAAAVGYSCATAPAGSEVLLRPGDDSVVSHGQQIYAEHCAACHGANLEGQPNWRQRDAEGYLPAPPHDATGHTWHHADQLLFEITKFGTAKLAGPDYKTRMPAYQDILSDQQIVAVLSFIKSRWPKQVQQRHDSLNEARKNR